MNRKIQWITIILFIALLLAPGIQALLKPFTIPVLNENRRRAGRPAMTIDGVLSTNATYGKEFENYFNDHYGFRDALIRTKNQIDFSLFHQSEELIIGKEGYLFYRSVVEHEEFDLELEWEEGREGLWKNLTDMRDNLAARHILFVFVVFPMKNTLYPELLPSWSVKRPKMTAFHKLRRMLDESDLLHVDAYRSLVENADDGPFFHRTDFHWNDVGAAYVARDIVNYLGEKTGTRVQWTSPITKTPYENYSGGQNLSLAIIRLPTEQTWINNPVLTNRSTRTMPDDPFRFSYTSLHADASPLLPKTVVIGDSFGECFRSTDFPYYFEELHHLPYLLMHDFYSKIPADTKIVIFATIETNLLRMLRDPERKQFWPDLTPPINTPRG